MRKLAWHGIKRRKKQMWFLTAAVACSVILILFSVAAKDGISETSREQRLDDYGMWTGAFLDSTKYQREALASHEAVEQIGTMKIYGTILSEEGKETGGIGSTDEEMERLGRISLLEGHMPEKADEIAVERRVLDRLDSDCHLGEEITFTVEKDGEKAKETYRLCGILRDYSEKWEKKGRRIAVGIVTEREKPQDIHQFFYGKKYEDVSKTEELSVFRIPFDGSYFLKNRMAYESFDIGMENVLQSGFLTLLIIISSVSIIFYIQLMMFQGRKNVLLTLCGVGASKGQILSLLLWEDVYILLYALPAGSVLGVLLAGLVMKALRFKSVFGAGLIGLAVAAAAVSFLFSTMLMYFSIRKLQIAASFRTSGSSLERRAYPKIKSIRVLTPFRMFLRSRRFMRGQILLRMGTALFGILFIMAGMTGADIFYKEYVRIGASKEADYEWHQVSDPGAIIDEVEKTEGIREVRYYRGECYDEWDWHIRYTWNGIEDSSYLKKYNKVIRNKKTIPAYNLEILSDLSGETGRYYASCTERGEVDEEAFRAGEEVIVVMPSYVEKGGKAWQAEKRELPYLKDLKNEETLKCGDEITVSFGTADVKPLKVKVGGIIRTFEERKGRQQQIAKTAGDLIVSQAFMEKSYWKDWEKDSTFDMTNTVTYIYAYTDGRGNLTQTEKSFSSLVEGDYGTFINHREMRRTDGNMKLSFFFLSAGVSLTAFLLSVMILVNGRQMRMKTEKQKNRVLQSLGMDTVVFRKYYLMEGLTESILLLLANSIIVFGVYAICLYAATPVNTFSGLFYMAAERFPWGVYVYTEGIYFLIYLCISQSFVKESTKWELF